MTLKITNEEHYNKVLAEVKELDKKYEGKFELMKKLEEQFDYLRNYGGSDEWEVHLGYDWAELSFSIAWFRDSKCLMHGGLIFHSGAGFNDGSFSVEIGAPKGPHWSVHT